MKWTLIALGIAVLVVVGVVLWSLLSEAPRNPESHS